MTKRSWLGVPFLVATVGVAALVACSSSETPPDVPSYGPPNGITGKTPSTPGNVDSGAAPAPTSTTPSGGDGGNPPITTFACGTPVDAGTCTVSWKTLYQKMTSQGPWKCSDATSCHGPGKTAPTIVDNDAHAAYVSLINYKFEGGNYYINPCSTDPAKSSFQCNTTTTSPCGSPMPLPSTLVGPTPPTAQEQADILTWVKCGAPEN